MPVWSLKRRMLLLNVGFLSAAIVLLGFFFFTTQQSTLERFLLERGVATTTQLALLSAATGTDVADELMLQKLADIVLEEHLVRSVKVHLDQFNLTINAGPGMLPVISEHPVISHTVVVSETQGSYRFVSPITIEQTSNDWSEQQLGWVEVEYANYPIIIRMFEVLLTIGGVVIGLLLALMALALYLSTNHNRKVKKIMAAVDEASSAPLAPTIDVGNDGDDLDLISDKLNKMWAQLNQAQKEAERSAAQTTRDLRETLETLEVQNIELDLARKEAVNASQVKSEFLANTSHEIRTPLNGIIGFTNLILKTQLSDKQTDYVNTIRQSANGLLRIINDILDFSKIEAGKLVLDYITINFFDLLEETMTLMAPMSNDKDIVLSIVYHPDVPEFVTADPQRLQQVMTNLVHNAIKFTDAGFVQIEVCLISEEEIQVSVHDTGIGMSDEHQRNLFDSFSQGDRSVSRNYGGTGLGLVIAQRLVEQMGSSIVLYSQEGEGSTFKFNLHTKVVAQRTATMELDGLQLGYMHPDTGLAKALQQIFARWKLSAEKMNSWQDCEDHLASAESDTLGLLIGIHEANLHSPTDMHALGLLAQSNKVILLCPRELQGQAQSKLGFDPERILLTPVRRTELYDALHMICGPYNQRRQAKSDTQDLNELAPRQRVLIVDDNPANLKLLRLMLEQESFSCVAVGSGAQAIDQANREVFEMIFMDIQMPEMSGTEAAQLIRQNSKLNKATPVIAVTAHAHAEDKNAFLRSGMNDYLGKPIMEDQLKNVLNRWSQDNSADFRLAANKAYAQEVAEETSGPVDLAQCLKLAANNSEIAEEMLAGLLDSLAEQRDKILALATGNDTKKLKEAVHYLHGHACYTGVPELRQLCSAIETRLKTEQPDGEAPVPTELLDALDVECERLLNWYEEHDVIVLFEA